MPKFLDDLYVEGNIECKNIVFSPLTGPKCKLDNATVVQFSARVDDGPTAMFYTSQITCQTKKYMNWRSTYVNSGSYPAYLQAISFLNDFVFGGSDNAVDIVGTGYFSDSAISTTSIIYPLCKISLSPNDGNPKYTILFQRPSPSSTRSELNLTSDKTYSFTTRPITNLFPTNM